jgi:hypothetical protein
MSNHWTVHNGHSAILRFELAGGQDIGPDNPLQFVFNQVDSMLHTKLKYLCISPYTKPNPKGFEYVER